MILFNIIFLLLSLMMMYRGYGLFRVARVNSKYQESAIAMAIVLMHGIVAVRSLLLIEIGPHRIEQAGLLLNYYLFLGTIMIQLVVSDFIIKFLTENISKSAD